MYNALYAKLCKVILKFLYTWNNPFSTHIELISKAVEGNECKKWQPGDKQLAAMGTPSPLLYKEKESRPTWTPPFVFSYFLVPLLTYAFLLSFLMDTRQTCYLSPQTSLHGELSAFLTASAWPWPLFAWPLPSEIRRVSASFFPLPDLVWPSCIHLHSSLGAVCISSVSLSLSLAGDFLSLPEEQALYGVEPCPSFPIPLEQMWPTLISPSSGSSLPATSCLLFDHTALGHEFPF